MIRIHELSKQLGIPNKELIELLRARNPKVEYKSASSNVDKFTVEELVKEFEAKAQANPPPAAAPEPPPVVEEPKPKVSVLPPNVFVRSKEEVEKEREEREAAQRKSAVVVPPSPPAPVAPVGRPASGPVPPPPVVMGKAPPPPPPLPPRSGPPPVGPIPTARPAAAAPAPASASPAPVAPAPSRAPIPGLRPQGAPVAPAPTPAPVLPPRAMERVRESTPEVTYPQVPAKASPSPAPALPPRGPSPVVPPRAAAGAPPAVPPTPSSSPAAAAGEAASVVPSGDAKLLQIRPPIVVRDFATVLNLRPFRLISELMDLGVFAGVNQAIEPDVAAKVAAKHGFLLEVRHRGDQSQAQPKKVEVKVDEDDVRFLEPRPPVVCILGHVDHGKTTLLDSIRNAHVAAGEAGGITQHIGAYQIEHKGKKITFLDTPGHAAFSQMRARGASVTDVAILVVAADDGFMPQTDEAFGHAKRASVPVVVAINKIDAPGAKVDRVKQQMQERGIAPEDWGGETLCTPVSALKGTGIPDLLDSILLQAEIMELRANPKATPEGVVIEAQKEIGQGSTATVIIEKGTLKPGDAIVCGPHYAKVRTLLSDRGDRLKEAPPSSPVKIVGWSSVPDAGQTFRVVKNEREAKRIAEENELEMKRAAATESAGSSDKVRTMEDLLAAINQTQRKSFRVLVKADVYGTAEALASALEGIKSEKITLEVVDMGVGPISKNDIGLASSANSAIVAFNIGLENGVAPVAKHHGVRILTHNIIYELIDQVREAMVDQLDPEFREQKMGGAEVRAVFPVSKGTVAGCMVTDGRVVRDANARLLRKGKVIAEGRVGTLRRFKDDVTEVRAGYECGIRLDGCDAYEVGDTIETYEILKLKPSL